MPNLLTFRGIHLALTRKERALEVIDNATRQHPVRIATANPEFIELAQHHEAFRTALHQMTHVTIDGSGLYFMLKLWKITGKTNFSPDQYPGADMVRDLFERYKNGERRFFFLGGAPGVMEKAAEAVKRLYPKITIVGTAYGGIVSDQEGSVSTELTRTLTAAKPDILLVAFGAPKQELWIEAARNILSIPVMIGVGGSLDFFVQKKRAPEWMRSLHLEWLYRSISEPGHWRRAFRATILFPLRTAWWLFLDFFSPSEIQ
jgi:N-acetylglucosaminyldiphosphoundecaprenol N-acetyl-beta-D-mannosaminyltransferase